MGKITRTLVENGNISKENEAVYLYTLKSMLILGVNILLSLLIGIHMGMFGYCVLFLCALIPLRTDAGGYHASNMIVCYLLSFVSLIFTMFWVKDESISQTIMTVVAATVSMICIFLSAPLDSRNKPIEGNERKRIRKRARIIVCLEWLAGWLLFIVKPVAAYTVWSAIVWCGIGYIAWFVEKKIRISDEKH